MPQEFEDEGIQERPHRRRREEEYDDDEFEERPRRRRRREEGDATGGIIPYKNPTALIGYYCGVFGLIPGLGLILAPAACVLGLMGLRYVSQHPTAKGTGHAITALVLGGLSMIGQFGCVAFAIISAVASKK